MKRSKFYTIFPLAAISILALTSCNLEVNPPSDSGSSLVTAINYNAKQRIIYSLDSSYTRPVGTDGKTKTYTNGDFKPFWEFVQNLEFGEEKRKIVLKEHAAAANSGEKKSVAYFRDNWLNKPYADISMGTVNAITKYSVAGNKETILDLKPYIDQTEFVDDKPGSAIKTPGVLPNLAKFLHDNPGVNTSIMTAKHSKANKGALYFVPYMDGFNDAERLMMVRQDYITKLLDNNVDNPEDPKVKFYDVNENIIGVPGSGAKYTLNYEPYINDNDEDYKIMLPNVKISGADAGEIDTEKHSGNKNYEYKKKKISELTNVKKNIIDQQNDLIRSGQATSKKMAKQFQDYIEDRYFTGFSNEDKIFDKKSDLFLGWKACFDTDELIALMRLVKLSSKTIYGESDDKEMVPWFPSEWTNMRSADLYRWGGQVFGVRGTDSRTGYLYFNGMNTFKPGFNSTEKIHDCRGDEQMVDLIKQLQKLYKEGLLMQDFDSITATGTNNKYFNEQLILEYRDATEQKNSKKYHGFMEYYTASAESKLNEYNQTYKPKSDKWTEADTVFGPIVGAVTKWDTNNDKVRDKYMQFTESWISAKTSGLCLNADLANNNAKRQAAFDLIDYIFSPKGKADFNYGPMEYGYYYSGSFQPDGNYKLDLIGEQQLNDEVTKYGIAKRKGTVTYKGKSYPQSTYKAETDNKTVDGVARERIGITLPFGYEKMNSLIYEGTRDKSKIGIDKINKAVDCGTFKHTCINDVVTEYTGLDDSLIAEFNNDSTKKAFYKIIPASFYLTDGQNTDIARILDKTKLGSMYTDDNQSQFNIWDDYVMGKKSASAPKFEKYLETVNGAWECPKLVTYYQLAYELMV